MNKFTLIPLFIHYSPKPHEQKTQVNFKFKNFICSTCQLSTCQRKIVLAKFSEHEGHDHARIKELGNDMRKEHRLSHKHLDVKFIQECHNLMHPEGAIDVVAVKEFLKQNGKPIRMQLQLLTTIMEAGTFTFADDLDPPVQIKKPPKDKKIEETFKKGLAKTRRRKAEKLGLVAEHQPYI